MFLTIYILQYVLLVEVAVVIVVFRQTCVICFCNFWVLSDIQLDSGLIIIKSIIQNVIKQDSFFIYVRFRMVWVHLHWIGFDSIYLSSPSSNNKLEEDM